MAMFIMGAMRLKRFLKRYHLLSVAILYKIPMVIYIVNFVYAKVAENRYLLSDTES